MAGKFGFILHPLDVSDVGRKFPFVRRLPGALVEAALKHLPPNRTSHVTGVRSPYNEAEGWFVGVTLTTRQMMSLPESFVLDKIVAAGRLAERQGARIIGLGAFTAVVGDAGFAIAERLDAGVTTGNSYTAATAIEGAKEGARFMGIDLEEAEVAVVGATGSIGRACALLMARDCQRLTLVGRSEEKLERLAGEVLRETGVAAQISADLKKSLPRADVIITVSSAVESIIDPEDLKPGAVVCDVARPRDVSRRVAEVREDVLVIEGGVVDVPGDVDFGLNFGYPPRTCMACMAETMILALEEHYGDYTLGREYSMERIEEISRLARKHGFRLAGLRSFERAFTREEMERIRANARRRRGLPEQPAKTEP